MSNQCSVFWYQKLVTKLIFCCTKPIVLMFHHMMGHQKETLEHEFTLPKQLNVNCHAQATKLPPLLSDSNLDQTPMTEAGYLHLCIKH